VSRYFKEAAEKIFILKKELRENKKLTKRVKKYERGMHLSDLGARLCPGCSKGRLSGFFGVLFEKIE
jgi:hypothetical protein